MAIGIDLSLIGLAEDSIDDDAICDVLIVRVEESWTPRSVLEQPDNHDIVEVVDASVSQVTFGSAKALCVGFNRGELEQRKGYWACATQSAT